MERIDTIAWASLRQPSWNAPDEVPRALARLAGLVPGDEASRAYHGFLYAIGNDHAGTYYPVVLQTLPFLESILDYAYDLPRQTTLDILVDLIGSFCPEPEYLLVEDDAGAKVQLRLLVRDSVRGMSPTIAALLENQSCGGRTRDLAVELLSRLGEAP